MLHQSAPLFDPPLQRDATSVDPISNTKRFALLSQEHYHAIPPAIAHTRKNDLLEVATTLRSMMQYGGERRRTRPQNMQQQNGRAQHRPSLPAELIKPPCRRQGGLITYQDGGYER